MSDIVTASEIAVRSNGEWRSLKQQNLREDGQWNDFAAGNCVFCDGKWYTWEKTVLVCGMNGFVIKVSNLNI